MLQGTEIVAALRSRQHPVDVLPVQRNGAVIALLCRFGPAGEDGEGGTQAATDAAEDEGDQEAVEEAVEDEEALAEAALERRRAWRRVKPVEDQLQIDITPGGDGPGNPVTTSDIGVRPIHASWLPYPFPSRPYTLRDFRLLRARHHPEQKWLTQARFDGEPRMRRHRERHKIPTVAGRFRTLWHLDSPRSLRVGVRGEETCWFLFIDGTCVADWRTAAPAGFGARVSPEPIDLAEGVHAVDLFTVVKRSEPMPRPVLVGEDGATGLLVEEDLLPPVATDAIRFDQLEEGDNLVRTEILRHRPRLLFEEAPGQSSLIVPIPFEQQVDDDHSVADLPSRYVGLAELTSVSTELSVADLPLLHSVDAEYEFTWRLSMAPDVAKRFPGLTRVRIGVEGAGSLNILDDVPVVGTPTEGRAAVPVDLTTQSIVVRCMYQGSQIAPERRIRLVSPDAFGPGLAFLGATPLAEGAPASLVWDPGGGRPASPARPVLRRLWVLDDFWDLLPSIGRQESVTDWLARELEIPVEHFGVVQTRERGIPDTVAKFALVADALGSARPGDHILFAVGQADLAAGRPALSTVAELQFLVQACRARKLNPVLLTLPPKRLPVPPRARRTALYTKEAAALYGLPVVDAYSAALLDAGGGAPAGIETPRADDRWLARLVVRTLKDNTQ